MSSNLDRYKKDIVRLMEMGDELLADLMKDVNKNKNVYKYKFNNHYQDWLIGVRSAINDYTGKKNFNDYEAAVMKFQTQLQILDSAKLRFDSSLFEIKQLIQADLFDSELEVSRELLKQGFIRAAGVVSGVILEQHLRQVCENHNLQINAKNPSINDYNESLKTGEVLDIPSWRFIQRLSDIRNLCSHNKDREPTKEEVHDLINGVDKIAKTIF